MLFFLLVVEGGCSWNAGGCSGGFRAPWLSEAGPQTAVLAVTLPPLPFEKICHCKLPSSTP